MNRTCSQCPKTCEEPNYTICEKCYRNDIEQLIRPKNFDLASVDPVLSVSQRVSYGHMSATVETTINVDGELFTELLEEQMVQRINRFMDENGYGLDEALLRLGTNDYSPIDLKMYCFTLLSRVTC